MAEALKGVLTWLKFPDGFVQPHTFQGSFDYVSDSLRELNALFKFVLLRFDELGELAMHLRVRMKGGLEINKSMLEQSLLAIKDAKWRNLGEYARYLSDPEYERRDFTKNSAWVVTNAKDLPQLPASVRLRRDGVHVLIAPANSSRELTIPGFVVEPVGPGKVRLEEDTKNRPDAKKNENESKTENQ